MVTVKNTNEAMLAVRELNYEDDGELLYSSPQKPPAPPVLLNRTPAKFGAVEHLRGITIGDTPYIAVPVAYLAELLNAVYGDASLARMDGDKSIALWIADGAPSELDAMNADLDALRAGEVKPLATMTLDEAAAVGQEWIGAEYSVRPWEW